MGRLIFSKFRNNRVSSVVAGSRKVKEHPVVWALFGCP